MPVDPSTTARSGASKFLILAQGLCRLVALSAPLIQARYPERTALQAVLTAAQGVCALLPAAQAEQAAADAEGFVRDPADATVIPGQNA